MHDSIIMLGLENCVDLISWFLQRTAGQDLQCLINSIYPDIQHDKGLNSDASIPEFGVPKILFCL